MSKEFFAFSEEPFGLDPDPRFFFLTENHKKVLLSLVYGITEAKGFTLLIGETGTGKTTFIHHLLSMLGPHMKAIPIFDPPKTASRKRREQDPEKYRKKQREIMRRKYRERKAKEIGISVNKVRIQRKATLNRRDK